MPHSAFRSEPVNEKLSVKIESIECWDKRLIVGTADGSLLLLEEAEDATLPEFIVIGTKKNISKSPIKQIQLCDTLNCCIILSDAVQVHALPNFEMRSSQIKTRGGNTFDVSTHQDTPLLACVVKKKLVLYKWNIISSDFDEWKEIALAGEAKSICWCGPNICVGYKREYSLINVYSGSVIDLFNTGMTANPVMFRMPTSDEILLGRDNFCVFENFEGKPTRKYGLNWSESPLQLGMSFPYILALLPRCIEVQSVETQMVVQSLRVNASHFVVQKTSPIGPAVVFAVADNNIYRLNPVPIEQQLDQLLESKEYEAALAISGFASNPMEQQQYIHTQYGFHMYTKGQYAKAAEHFDLADTNPEIVLYLIDDKSVGHPGDKCPVSPLTDPAQIKEMYAASSTFWINAKKRIPLSSSDKLKTSIDTALLKSFIYAKAFTKILPFLSDTNYCEFGECERLLLQHQLYNELVALYRSSGKHRQAMEMLKEHGQGPKEHPLYGVEPTINYLKTLGKDYERLIFDSSRWVLRADPIAGLRIFTEETSADNAISPDTVLQHLKAVDAERKGTSTPPLCMLYLEHLVNVRKETGSHYHNELILMYLDAVMKMKYDPSHPNSSNSIANPIYDPIMISDGRSDRRVAAGEEIGPLGAARSRLLKFLIASKWYNAEKMLAKFPFTDLYEERALLLGRLGKHDDALAIYVHRLQDYKLAEQYCDRLYDPNDPITKDVYLALLSAYLRPADGAPLLQQAMGLMSRHVDKIDPAMALDLLPGTTTLRALLPFFEAALRANCELRRQQQVQKNLLKAENIKVWEERRIAKAKRIKITWDRTCKVCNRRIGNSVFACYPNMTVVHFSCAADRSVCPVTNTVFDEHNVKQTTD